MCTVFAELPLKPVHLCLEIYDKILIVTPHNPSPYCFVGLHSKI